MTSSDQRMLRREGPLLQTDGSLADVGWARQPILDCNMEDAKSAARFWQWARNKRWDYFGITTSTHFFSFTLANLGYAGTVFAYVIEFATQVYKEMTLTIPLGRNIDLPRNSDAGVSHFSSKAAELTFSVLPGARHLSVNWRNFGSRDLRAEVDLALDPLHESMVIVIPIQGKRFYYNRKVNCMPASGWVDYGGQRFELNPNTCLGNLDWGRGVWERDSFWVWASASGFLPDRRSLGLNLGYGFGDLSAATENAVILDGRVHKLGQVDFDYDLKHFKRPWRMCSPDSRLDLTFTPFFERVARTDIKLVTSEVHQMFGRYTGMIVTDEGERIEVKDLVGWAEEHHARW